MAGHLFRNQVTVGSNPTFSSMGLIPQTGKGRVAGDVKSQSAGNTQLIAGSNPARSTRRYVSGKTPCSGST